MAAPETTYGFIGLGVMGFPMALNLRQKIPKGSKLFICELSEKQRTKFMSQAEGEVTVADSPRAVAEQADIILTSLPAGKHVEFVFNDPETGLLSLKPTGRKIFFIETSTIETATSLEVSKAVADSGLGDFIDAPISGGPNGAYAGSLTFMVGGPKNLYERALPILKTMGKEQSLFHCGDAGAGLATKQINNYLSGVCIVGTSEAMDMGIKYGLDPKVLSNVINVSTGRNYNSLEQNPINGVTATAAASKDFVGGFSIELATGVIRMAVELSKQVGAKTLVADTVIDAFEKACADKRCAGKDCRSLYKWLANVEDVNGY